MSDGANPQAGLIFGADGNLYGTTSSGGANSIGTAFQVSTNGSLVTLYSFGAVLINGYPVDGDTPRAGLVQGPDGTLYGTTYYGGTNGQGTVFKVTPSGAFSSLYSFGAFIDAFGTPLDGEYPYGGLALGADGNLYGTTEAGGTNDVENGGAGTVFRITTNGVLTTVYSFNNSMDGAHPDATLTLANGNFYGTALLGGPTGNGTIFNVSSDGAFRLLYDFPGGLDGIGPSAELSSDGAGNLYGTTEGGGSYTNGTLFKLQPNRVVTALFQFDGTNGSIPEGQLVRGPDGNFYGTASAGGTYASGVVFRFGTNGILTNLYAFAGADGSAPWAGLALGPDSRFYGTTSTGGTYNQGTVFNLTTNGVLTTILSFDGTNGAHPLGGALVLAADGNLYGTTSACSSGCYGTVFRVIPGGSVDVIYSFHSSGDGSNPKGGLAVGLDGNLYGTTSGGQGTIFRITTNGVLTTLHSLDLFNGQTPTCTLVRAQDGNFYGTTVSGGANFLGVVFQVKPDGTYTNLHSFSGQADGSQPDCGLVLGMDGNLYGVAENGGAANSGTIFELILADPPPVLLSLKKISSTVSLSWTAVAGRAYQVQFSTNVGQNTWTNLGPQILATNSIPTASDPNARDPRRFYRVALLP